MTATLRTTAQTHHNGTETADPLYHIMRLAAHIAAADTGGLADRRQLRLGAPRDPAGASERTCIMASISPECHCRDAVTMPLPQCARTAALRIPPDALRNRHMHGTAS